MQSFTYLGSAVIETPDISTEITRWTRACWMRTRRYLRELYDKPKVMLSLKIRIVTTKAIEALLSVWVQHVDLSPGTLRQTSHRTPPALASHHRTQRKRRDHRIPSDNCALEVTRCESIETTLRTNEETFVGESVNPNEHRMVAEVDRVRRP